MQIQKVKREENGWVINDNKFVPYDTMGNDNQEIEDWILNGGVVEFNLSEKKIQKISQVESMRDTANIQPITDIQAELLDSDGNGTGELSYFKFYTNRHVSNPASDPSSILAGVLNNNAASSYFSRDLDGNKIVVSITPAIARSLVAKMQAVNAANYRKARDFETSINDCTTVDEVRAININFE